MNADRRAAIIAKVDQVLADWVARGWLRVLPERSNPDGPAYQITDLGRKAVAEGKVLGPRRGEGER